MTLSTIRSPLVPCLMTMVKVCELSKRDLKHNKVTFGFVFDDHGQRYAGYAGMTQYGHLWFRS